ncbi:MAG: hypothetical protein H0T42_22435 [Deltaproteobacteria bacterium]|nr:hypothetical protein [Deltaproteobacteria bacterium]
MDRTNVDGDRRSHPVLLALWAGLIVASGLGLSNWLWFGLVFVGSPLLAIATFAALGDRRQVEVLRPVWWIAYRLAVAGLALAGIAGVVATAGQLAGHDADWSANAPFALLFLLAFLAAWPALTKPSPRRASLPAMVIHIAWIPLLIANAVTNGRRGGLGSGWESTLAIISLTAILALSAIVAVLALVSFNGEPRLAPARAT